MHFPIITIEPKGTCKENFKRSLPEDSTLEHFTDYYGDIMSDNERKKIISSSWLKKLFNGIATIDVKNETITFLDAATIKTTINTYFLECTERLHRLAEMEKLDYHILSLASHEYNDNSTMFYFNHCGWTSMEFISESRYYANQTFKIGNVFDGHC